MDLIYSYLPKKTNVKELNVEIRSKRSLFPGYSLETAKRFDNKSIAYRNLGLIVIGEGDCSIKPTLPVFEKVPMMQ